MLWIVIRLLAADPADADTRMKVRKLRDELKDEKSAQNWTAAQDLGTLGPDAKEAIPALREALKAKSVETRGHAAAALLLIDPAEAGRAWPVLREVFKDRTHLFLHLGLIEPLGQKLKPATKEIVAGLLQLAGEEVIFGWVI